MCVKKVKPPRRRSIGVVGRRKDRFRLAVRQACHVLEHKSIAYLRYPHYSAWRLDDRQPCHQLKRTVQRRPLSNSIRLPSANRWHERRPTVPSQTQKVGPTRPRCVRLAARRVIPSRSARPASAFGIAIRNARTNIVRNINMSAGSSRRFSGNEEASWMSAPRRIWVPSLNYRGGRSAQSACAFCRLV